MIFTAVVHQENDIFVAECPEVGSVSQGMNLNEALDNLKEATELYLDEVEYIPKGRTFVTTFEAAYHV